MIDKNEDYLLKIFKNKGEKLKFKIGQSLCDDKYLSGSIYLIEEGSARIIHKINKILPIITYK